MLSKALLVGALATTVDALVLYELARTNVNEQLSFIIASTCGLMIQFFGNKIWTFENQESGYFQQGLKFFALEIFLIYMMSLLYPYAIKGAEVLLQHVDPSNSTSALDSEGKISPTSVVVVKNALIFLTFNLVSYPLWKIIFA